MANSERNSSGFTFLAGAVIGAGVAYFLTTERGKRLTKNVANQGLEAYNTVHSKVQDTANVAAGYIKDKYQGVRDTAMDFVDNVKEKKDSLLESADDKLDDLEKGVAKAKKNIKNGVSA